MQSLPATRKQVDRWMSRGIIPYMKLGGEKQSPVRFNLIEVQAALMRFNRGVPTR